MDSERDYSERMNRRLAESKKIGEALKGLSSEQKNAFNLVCNEAGDLVRSVAGLNDREQGAILGHLGEVKKQAILASVGEFEIPYTEPWECFKFLASVALAAPDIVLHNQGLPLDNQASLRELAKKMRVWAGPFGYLQADKV